MLELSKIRCILNILKLSALCRHPSSYQWATALENLMKVLYVIAIIGSAIGGFFAYNNGLTYEVALLSHIGVNQTQQPLILGASTLMAFVIALGYIRNQDNGSLLLFATLAFACIAALVGINLYSNLSESILLIPIGLISAFAVISRFSAKEQQATGFLFFLFELGLCFGMGIYIAIQYQDSGKLAGEIVSNRVGVTIILLFALMACSNIIKALLCRPQKTAANLAAE